MRGLADDDKFPTPGRGFPTGLKFALIVIISIVLMTIDTSHDKLGPVRSSLAVAMQPLQVLAEIPTDISQYVRRYLDRSGLIEQNRDLSKKVLLLQARLQKLAALKAENKRIRALLDSSRSLEHSVLIAEILSVSPSPYKHYIKINKGSLDGVTVGQVLIDAGGIMGQITNVTPMQSRAILITDADHAVPVEINRTGLRTIAKGTGQSDQLRLPFLPGNEDIQDGDLLVTSGLGGRYPSGYPVAVVTHVDQSPGSEFLDVTAQPTAHLNHGNEVLLIQTSPPRQHTTDADRPDDSPIRADSSDATP